MQIKTTSITQMAMGAVGELLDDALTQVIKNIQDPNTKATQKRKVVLTVEFNPLESRDTCSCAIKVEPKLAAHREVSTHVFIGVRDNEAVMYEQNPDQKTFDFHPEVEAE